MRTGYHGALGLVFSEDLPYAFADSTAIQFLQGVAQACQERRANLLLIATRAEGERADATFGASPLNFFGITYTGFYLNNNGTTINHFYEKLLLLKDRMNTATGRAMAEERHRFMEEFLRRFYEEWEGDA